MVVLAEVEVELVGLAEVEDEDEGKAPTIAAKSNRSGCSQQELEVMEPQHHVWS